MTLHDERGGGFHQMMLALCVGAAGPMLSYDTAGWLEAMTLHDERGGSNQMLLLCETA